MIDSEENSLLDDISNIKDGVLGEITLLHSRMSEGQDGASESVHTRNEIQGFFKMRSEKSNLVLGARVVTDSTVFVNVYGHN